MMRLRDMIKGNLLPLLAMLLLLLIFFGKFLLGETRFSDSEHLSDAYLLNQPLYTFLQDSFSHGEFPLWNPYILSGNPAYNGVSTMGLSAFMFPLSLLYDINMLIILSIALFGMYLFLVEIVQLNKPASVIGAITFAFSGFFMVWLHQTYTIGGIVFLPWNLYFLDKALSKKSIPFAIAAGISISLALVNGVSQMFIYTLMAVTAFFIFRTAPLLKQARKEALYSSSLFFLILGIGFCLSGIYVLHYLELLQLSHRPDLTYGQVTGPEGAQPLINLITYLIPDFYGSPADGNPLYINISYIDTISYLGMFPFMLAVISLFSEKNRYTYFFWGLAVFSLFMALGSPLYALFYYVFPILAKARSTARINILINFSIAVLAAIGAHNLMEGKINKKTILLICWGFMFVFAAGCLIFFDKIVEKPKYQFLLQFIVWINALSAIGFYALKHIPDREGIPRRGSYFPYLCMGAFFLLSAITVYCALFLNMTVWRDYALEGNSRYAWKLRTLLKEGDISQGSSQWNLLYAYLAVGAIITLLYFRLKTGERSKKIFFIVFISLTAFELMRYGMGHNPYHDREVSTLSKTPGISFLQKDNELFRILPFNGKIMPGNTALNSRLQNVAGYEGVYPKWYNRLISEVELRTPVDSALLSDAVPDKGFGHFVNISNINSVILDMLNVKYIVTQTQERLDAPGWTEDYYNYIRNLVPVYFGEDFLIYKNKNYMQRAFLVPEVKVENDGEKIIKDLFSDTFDPRRYAIVETKEDKLSFPPSDPILLKESSLIFERYKNNSVSLKAEMKDQGFLVLADNYYPGWKVFVDGKEQTLYKTNYSLRGVHLEKGKHLIKFVYDPLSFKIGMYLSLSTLFGIMAYFVWYRFFKGKQSDQRSI